MTVLWLTQTAVEQLAAARDGMDTPFIERLMGFAGIGTMICIAWLLSVDRKRVSWSLVAKGVALQVVFALLVLKTPVGRSLFEVANGAFLRLRGFADQGAEFLFGNLVQDSVPVGIATGAHGESAALTTVEFWAHTGASFAFSVLPTIVFFASLVSVLYYMGIMERFVKGFAWIMFRTMRTSGAETLSVAGNIFIGPIESPLLIKPFIKGMTRSELNTVMVGGLATIAGGVMAAYVGMLSSYFPDIAGHLLTASVMNAPAALLISKILVPETEESETKTSLDISVKTEDANLIDAAAGGAAQGLKLALNVGAMLMAFIALIAMLNAIVGGLGGLVGFPELSVQQIFGWVLAPLAWLMGVPWADAMDVGSLMGIKVVINEFVAYLQLAGGLEAGSAMSPRAVVICTYALLGFANFGTIAMLIGGIGGIAPERRRELSLLGIKAMIGGNLAAFMSASLAGMVL